MIVNVSCQFKGNVILYILQVLGVLGNKARLSGAS